jgi:class 3 adenylate cyclase
VSTGHFRRARGRSLHALTVGAASGASARKVVVLMVELPSGTVTFLFSDIESSTRLLRELGDDWEETLAAHNRILRESFAEAGGREVDRQGDAFFAVFPTARTALESAATAQRALAAHTWPRVTELRVRMGVHTGEPSIGGEGYLGVDVVRAARICSAAHGGQVLVSESTRALVGGADLEDLGLHHLKDMEHPERLFQLVVRDLPSDFPPPRALGRPQETPPTLMAGRELELASRATALAERFEGLGPAIDRQVREALAAKGLHPPDAPKPQEAPKPSRDTTEIERPRSAFVLAGFVVLVVAALVAIVYLIAQAL